MRVTFDESGPFVVLGETKSRRREALRQVDELLAIPSNDLDVGVVCLLDLANNDPLELATT